MIALTHFGRHFALEVYAWLATAAFWAGRVVVVRWNSLKVCGGGYPKAVGRVRSSGCSEKNVVQERRA